VSQFTSETAIPVTQSVARSIAVLIPCYNEAVTIRQVIHDFRAALPTAQIYVYDNNSSDQTVDFAKAAGAIVRSEPMQGKGNVVRRMFGDVDADLYIMVDGDGTYDASAAPRLVATLVDGSCDMVNVVRSHTEREAYRPGHVIGNRVLTRLVELLFGTKYKVTDMMSGYKAFTRRFVKSFPATSRNFEIETELMIHCLDLRLPIGEIVAAYGSRPEGSSSKLHTIRDGLRVVKLLGWFLKHEKPFVVFSLLAVMLAAISLGLGIPIVSEFFETGLVPRLPTAVLAATIMLSAVVSFFSGVVLDTVTHSRREMKRLFYLLQLRSIQ
jgi:glycosyltransferase involved in cell wall biosynthesis